MRPPIRDLVAASVAGLSAYAPPEGNYRIRLDANESPFDLPEVLRAKIRRRWEEIPANRYPDPGAAGLKRSFAARFGCRPSEVMPGNGSDELIALLLWTFRKGAGGHAPRILVPVPTFSMYALLARSLGFEVLEAPFRPDLAPDVDGLLALSERGEPNLTFLAAPNNPTGGWYTPDQIDALLTRGRGILVVDEAYADFSAQPSQAPNVGARSNLAVLRTLSKIGGAALRCGFLAASEELLFEVNRVRLPFNLNAFTQAAGEVVLDGFDHVAAVARLVAAERDRIAPALASLGLAVFPSQANFLLVKASGREEELFRFLQEGSIVVKLLPALGVAGDCLRITVGTIDENEALLGRVGDFFGAHRGRRR